MTLLITATLITTAVALITKTRNDAPWADMREARAHYARENLRLVDVELRRR